MRLANSTIISLKAGDPTLKAALKRWDTGEAFNPMWYPKAYGSLTEQMKSDNFRRKEIAEAFANAYKHLRMVFYIKPDSISDWLSSSDPKMVEDGLNLGVLMTYDSPTLGNGFVGLEDRYYKAML